MKEIDAKKRSVGVNFENGVAAIVVWAPMAKTLSIRYKGKELALIADEEGFWQNKTDQIKPGDQYTFVVDEKELPDPASLYQPDGVHKRSEAVDLKSFQWTDQEWKNLALGEYTIYELHTGTFTPEGTLKAIESKLDYLIELGINAIELMPLAQFPGNRNWGYDGVYPFAVQNTYGGPKALQQLVDTCHRKGLAVILDVVYNHLGPEGNYLTAFGPYFTDKYKTPWGGALNFDDAWCDGVRRYFIENALMWFRDFHVDALRMDAIHAIKDLSPKHILQEISEYTRELERQTAKKHYLIAELDLNDNRFINPIEQNGYGLDAQWVDEFHHALRVTAGGDRNGYYEDFTGIAHLAKAYKDAYVFDGQYSPHRKKHFGVRTENPGDQFIVFSQNHDQVGNRMLGERTSSLVSFEMQKLLAGAVFVSPYIPMLFMGEEYAEPHPFLYFVSHTDPELQKAVAKGRKEEFAAFHAQGEAPDPNEEKTFESSKLQWTIINEEPHKTMLAYYKELIRVRKANPALAPNRKNLHVDVSPEKGVLQLHRWTDKQDLLCVMNFSFKEQSFMPASHIQEYHKIFDSAEPKWLGPAAAPSIISGGQPGSSAVTVQPESIVIYTNN